MEEIARAAGAVLRKHHLARGRAGLRVRTKGTPTDLVTEVDKKAEAVVKKMIADAYPDHGIVSEEGAAANPRAQTVWYVDPLDGTTNFVHGYPHFAVSIAVVHRGKTVVGCVYDPIRDELFLAASGGGAFLNGRPMHVSATRSLGRSLLATGFPYDLRESPENNLDFWSAFAFRARALRRDGSAALNLCYVAAGRFDGFWEMKLKPWDMAAGMLMVEKAGGRLSDFGGGPAGIFLPEVVADNGRIHRQMLDVLRQVASGR
ncbi:MAG: inositol monophosphatase [Deltaproteobacteria bacterium]|nr:inositol monophosphatase [Deltaproteobacteria bacterium]